MDNHHDPLPLALGEHKLFVDLGAERLLGAERGNERIALSLLVFDVLEEEIRQWLP